MSNGQGRGGWTQTDVPLEVARRHLTRLHRELLPLEDAADDALERLPEVRAAADRDAHRRIARVELGLAPHGVACDAVEVAQDLGDAVERARVHVLALEGADDALAEVLEVAPEGGAALRGIRDGSARLELEEVLTLEPAQDALAEVLDVGPERRAASGLVVDVPRELLALQEVKAGELALDLGDERRAAGGLHVYAARLEREQVLTLQGAKDTLAKVLDISPERRTAARGRREHINGGSKRRGGGRSNSKGNSEETHYDVR
ncbi:hypothetical protein B0H21DRAFT_749776 [Amylocystis lapponica]|nr:hypothetical protein B0H21DRAFT_749776 [Amylocystis lapponica]